MPGCALVATAVVRSGLSERRLKFIANAQDAQVILSRGYTTIDFGVCNGNCTLPTGQWSLGTLNTSANMDSLFPSLPPCQFATWFFDYAMSAGVTSPV